MYPESEQHVRARGTLRAIGCLVLLAGPALIAFGIYGLLHWKEGGFLFVIFLGGASLIIGGFITFVANAGRIQRYMANETAPVGKDLVNYMVDETEGSIRKAASAVGEGLGLKEPGSSKRPLRCPQCAATNDADANFCDNCGAALVKSKRCECGELNDPDARFCDNCGKPLR